MRTKGKVSDEILEGLSAAASADTSATSDKVGENFISTGSSLLNLALSDNAKNGFALGKLVNVIGDSSSGKTFLAFSVLAEAAYSPRFENYDLIFDDVENALEFNVPALFGRETSRRLKACSVRSTTIESFFINVMAKIEEADKPFIYVLDSFDALTSEAEQKRTKKLIKSGESPGSYAMEKAKAASSILRQITAALKDSQSLVIIISQTRDNINPMSFEKKTRSGGRALKFYASYEMWLAVRNRIKHGSGIVVGTKTAVKVSKNKLTGKERRAYFSILNTYGIDDLEPSIEWLLEQGVWKKIKGMIRFDKAQEPMRMDKLIKWIESGHVGFLRKCLQQRWNELEESVRSTRNPKYS